MKNKTATIILIVILSIIVLTFSFLFINVLLNDSFNFFNLGFSNGYKVSSKLTFEKSYDASFDEIIIKANASDIEVKESLTDEIKVLVYEDKNETKVETYNNKLRITSSKRGCVGFCFNQVINKIEVYLPSTYEKEVKIDNDFGDIEIEKINIATITNGYGDIKVDEAKRLDIEADCGDIEINKVDNIKAVNKFGDIEIKEVNEYINANDDCGDIEIKSLFLKKNSSIENSMGNIEIGSTNEIYINAKTSLGDTDIRNNYPKSDITLTINNSCGDIEVEN